MLGLNENAFVAPSVSVPTTKLNVRLKEEKEANMIENVNDVNASVNQDMPAAALSVLSTTAATTPSTTPKAQSQIGGFWAFQSNATSKPRGFVFPTTSTLRIPTIELHEASKVEDVEVTGEAEADLGASQPLVLPAEVTDITAGAPMEHGKVEQVPVFIPQQNFASLETDNPFAGDKELVTEHEHVEFTEPTDSGVFATPYDFYAQTSL